MDPRPPRKPAGLQRTPLGWETLRRTERSHPRQARALRTHPVRALRARPPRNPPRRGAQRLPKDPSDEGSSGAFCPPPRTGAQRFPSRLSHLSLYLRDLLGRGCTAIRRRRKRGGLAFPSTLPRRAGTSPLYSPLPQHRPGVASDAPRGLCRCHLRDPARIPAKGRSTLSPASRARWLELRSGSGKVADAPSRIPLDGVPSPVQASQEASQGTNCRASQALSPLDRWPAALMASSPAPGSCLQRQPLKGPSLRKCSWQCQDPPLALCQPRPCSSHARADLAKECQGGGLSLPPQGSQRDLLCCKVGGTEGSKELCVPSTATLVLWSTSFRSSGRNREASRFKEWGGHLPPPPHGGLYALPGA